MRQEVTRAHLAKGWALDNVILHNDVTKMLKEDVNSPPPLDVGKLITNTPHALRYDVISCSFQKPTRLSRLRVERLAVTM